jgi:hypothetical protein
MQTAQDIAVNSNNNELLIQEGDFAVLASDAQHGEHIVVSSKGNWTGAPLVGVGIWAYLNAPLSSLVLRNLRQKITLQFEYDGLKITELQIPSLDNIKINATRRPF